MPKRNWRAPKKRSAVARTARTLGATATARPSGWRSSRWTRPRGPRQRSQSACKRASPGFRRGDGDPQLARIVADVEERRRARGDAQRPRRNGEQRVGAGQQRGGSEVRDPDAPQPRRDEGGEQRHRNPRGGEQDGGAGRPDHRGAGTWSSTCRSAEEHTSELQSRVELECRLLLEKK